MRRLLFIINVDWYYRLHWRERIESEMTDGFEVHVCMAAEKGVGSASEPLPRSFEGRDIVYHEIAMHRTDTGLASNLRTLRTLRRILRDVGPDLIHTVTVKPNVLGGILARGRGLPAVLTLPGLGTVFSESNPRNRLLRQLTLGGYRWIAGNPNTRFVFENAADRELFRREKVIAPSSGYLSPGSGVDTDRYRPGTGAPDSPPLIVLFAARLLNQKGLDDLVAAVELRRDSGQRIRLLVAGIQDPSAPDAIDMRRLENWHESGRIEWLGRVDDMTGLLGRVHLVALPTKYGEGIPRILIEAAACGLPVLTTDIGGCGEFVVDGTTGRTVPPGDVPAIAAALAGMEAPDRRAAMGTAGRSRVEASYSRSHVIEVFRRIYADCTDGGR